LAPWDGEDFPVLETQNSTAAGDNFQVTGQIAAGNAVAGTRAKLAADNETEG